MDPPAYVGRFAPSPSGPLHFGSLVAAVGSYLQARTAQGKWLLRIEDLDTPRVVPGATETIVRTLDAFGFQWDGPVEHQSARLDLYRDALDRLRARGLVFPCSCSRAQIAALDEQRYPGICRGQVAKPGVPVAERFRVEPGVVEFTDRIQGDFVQNVADHCGDFVVQRRDAVFAYHLAVVVDDAEQGVTEVVRGGDLLDSTPRHVLLQRALGFSTPRYCHLPLAVDDAGQKLSKSSQSLPISVASSVATLWEALRFLKQAPPPSLRDGSLSEVWSWAESQWNIAPLLQVKSDRAPPPSSSATILRS
jgi:glutamyl-Q tRNA(Asp) synthetase